MLTSVISKLYKSLSELSVGAAGSCFVQDLNPTGQWLFNPDLGYQIKGVLREGVKDAD